MNRAPGGHEAALAAFFRSMPIAVSIVDPDSAGFLEVNGAFERVFGWTRAETIGRHGDDLPIWSPEERDRMLAAVRERDGTLRDFACKRLRKGGEPFDAVVSTEILDFGGRRYRINSIVDVSAEVQAREALRRSEEALERRVRERTAALEAANRELESFSYSISHDLRAPIRTVIGFSEILRREHGAALAPEAKRLLDRVIGAGERMGELVDALIELARIMRRPLVRIELDLSDLSAKLLAGFAERHPERRVASIVHPGMRASADPVLATSLVENLVANAWKYTARAEFPRIEIGTTGEAFFVADNGAGFDPRYADKLFRPFERLHSDAEFPGIGIGLATVDRIVQRHGGRAWAEGTPGGGATFYFTLPGTDPRRAP